MEKMFAGIFLAFTAVMIVLFGVFTEYAPPALRQGRYIFFQDVHVMIFIGFGFLMSFLHKGGFTATSHAFLVAALVVPWAVLNRGFWERAISEHGVWDKIQLSVINFIGGDFTAGGILISFGAMLGRVSATQLLVMALIEVVIFAINEMILVERFHVADIGGSMIIHTFGAYFGLACSLVLEKAKPARKDICSNANGSTRVTDTMAMVGTLFLFCFWPSFNAALAGETSQDRAVVNTLLALFMSTVGSFLVCCLVDAKGKFGMVEIQNSTIAGGVAIGASADMVVNPVGALIVGLVAGALSVVGYRFLTPLLEKKLGLRDTCGIHNLHGMPGVLAAIVSAIAAGAARQGSYQGTYGDVFAKADRERQTQAGYQLASLGVTLLFALVGGAITGAIIAQFQPLPTFFDDKHEYHVEGESDDEHHATTAVEMTGVTKPSEPTAA
jgi:ammonium transporter Rh